MEVVGGAWRTILGILSGIFFSVGYAYLGVMAMFIKDWRHLYWTISAPALLLTSYVLC